MDSALFDHIFGEPPRPGPTPWPPAAAQIPPKGRRRPTRAEGGPGGVGARRPARLHEALARPADQTG